MSSYATIDEAKSAGARGSDGEIFEAIEEASERVERFTGELFTPTQLTMELTVDADGRARARRRIKTIQSVTWRGASAPIAVTAYVVSSSANVGARDEIALYGDLSWADVTVLGAEPWNGGWAGLSGGEPRIVVVGTFGWDAPPQSVRMATALIAAELRGADVTPADGSGSGSTAADAEGNVLPVVPPFGRDEPREAAARLASVRHRTTGVLAADALLASYVREPVRMRA